MPEKYKPLFLALMVAILFLPMAFWVRKFTLLDPVVRPKVAFNPLQCYQCRECSCEFTLEDGLSYRLGRYDKTICKIGHEEINEGIDKRLSYMTVEMKIPEYREFIDCLKWYSKHPSTYGGLR
jgi:hypothetical protein